MDIMYGKKQLKEESTVTLIIPECIYCKEDIKKDEQALVIVPYPKKKGFTEIKAFLNIEGKFICENCKEKLSI